MENKKGKKLINSISTCIRFTIGNRSSMEKHIDLSSLSSFKERKAHILQRIIYDKRVYEYRRATGT